LRPLAAAFLDDITVGMRDKATLDAMGMSLEESEELMQKCQAGTMNFVDFLSMVCFLDHFGGSGGMVAEMARLPTVSETASMEEKIAEYKVILDAMTPEERSDPGLFLEADKDAREEREARLASAAGRSEAKVDQFLHEFKTMRSMLSQLGEGKSFAQMTHKMVTDGAEGELAELPRKKRRSVKKLPGGQKKKEWMDL